MTTSRLANSPPHYDLAADSGFCVKFPSLNRVLLAQEQTSLLEGFLCGMCAQSCAHAELTEGLILMLRWRRKGGSLISIGEQSNRYSTVGQVPNALQKIDGLADGPI